MAGFTTEKGRNFHINLVLIFRIDVDEWIRSVGMIYSAAYILVLQFVPSLTV
jgi:hypothetical protein